MQLYSHCEPTYCHQAAKIPEWQHAMKEELAAMEAKQTWNVVPLPIGKHILGCKRVYKLNLKSDGLIDRHKARLGAKGFAQQNDI